MASDADATLAEAVARLEYKVDILLTTLFKGVATPLVLGGGVCPVCKQQPNYNMDPIKKVVVRQCACRTGKLPPPDLDAYKPPPGAGGTNGGNRGSSEDGSDSSGGWGRTER